MARRVGLPLLAAALVIPCMGGTATLNTLYNFTDLADGAFPTAGLAMSSEGTLYGTTSIGGTYGYGSIFEVIPAAGGTSWTETSIYDFQGGPGDGATPEADLLVDTNGQIFGTTYYGGAHGYGAVFVLTPTSGGWTEKILYSFQGGATDGANPAAGLVIAAKTGALYGTTEFGGADGFGTVFQMVPAKSGWTEKVLYSFQGNTDGANPISDLLFSVSGTIYGTTAQGGYVTVTNTSSCTQTDPCVYQNQGTVFELAALGGGAWQETILYTFTGQSDGGTPESGLNMGTSGALYGTTFWGGKITACPIGDYPQGCGVVYQLLPPTGGATAWTESVLYAFTGHTPDGSHPYGNMGLNNGGDLFGTTYSGGDNLDVCSADSYNGCGTIFELKPSKTGTWTKSNLIAFPGSPGGGNPNGLILNSSGGMFGTTNTGGGTGGYGTVFQMSTSK